MDPLFPEIPADLKGLSDEELSSLISEHEKAKDLILNDDPEFTKGLTGEQIIEQLKAGTEQWKALKADYAERVTAHENFEAERAALAAEFSEETTEEETLEVVAEEDGDEGGDEAEEVEAEEAVEEKVPVLASAETPRFARTPPAPSAARTPKPTPTGTHAALVASGDLANQFEGELDGKRFAEMVIRAADHYGPAPKRDQPGQWGRYDGPSHKLARAEFEFPADRTLGSDIVENDEKIRAVLPNYIPGLPGKLEGEALVASGGLCAPLEPIYSMPNFATTDEPVWDALPKFRAARGGVNVPAATYIADIETAISSISEENDALGGTYATKSCQALDCPEYTEVAIQILAHCREYGNLNARAWPEKIRHENELTMAALSRTSEGFMLDRIKALSVNVTNGADTLGALIYLVDGIGKAMYGIRSRLRMPRGARFRVLLPAVIEDLMALDTISTQFDRYRSKEALVAYLRSLGIDPVFYLDTASTGESQIADASQAAGALDGFPDEIQWAIYPEGAFIGVDSGVLELGIVRDSTLNSTNDFQVFGERFRNVARLAPAQAAYWVTTNLCPVGQFPPAGTARTCESA